MSASDSNTVALNIGGLLATYGAPFNSSSFLKPIQMLSVLNLTDRVIFLSWNGAQDNIVIPISTEHAHILNFNTNRGQKDDYLMRRAPLFARALTAGGAGICYITAYF